MFPQIEGLQVDGDGEDAHQIEDGNQEVALRNSNMTPFL